MAIAVEPPPDHFPSAVMSTPAADEAMDEGRWKDIRIVHLDRIESFASLDGVSRPSVKVTFPAAFARCRWCGVTEDCGVEIDGGFCAVCAELE